MLMDHSSFNWRTQLADDAARRLTAGNFSPAGVISTAARSRTKLLDQPVIRFECNSECLCRQTLGFCAGAGEFKHALGNLPVAGGAILGLRLSRNAVAPRLSQNEMPIVSRCNRTFRRRRNPRAPNDVSASRRTLGRPQRHEILVRLPRSEQAQIRKKPCPAGETRRLRCHPSALPMQGGRPKAKRGCPPGHPPDRMAAGPLGKASRQ
jgi:hypothetical protein